MLHADISREAEETVKKKKIIKPHPFSNVLDIVLERGS